MKSRLVQNSRKKRTYNTTIGFFSFFLYLRLVCLFYCFKFVKLAVKIFYSLGVFSLFIFCIISKQPHFFGYLFVFFLLLLLSISYMVMVICLSLKKSPNYMFSLLLWIKYGQLYIRNWRLAICVRVYKRKSPQICIHSIRCDQTISLIKMHKKQHNFYFWIFFFMNHTNRQW